MHPSFFYRAFQCPYVFVSGWDISHEEMSYHGACGDYRSLQTIKGATYLVAPTHYRVSVGFLESVGMQSKTRLQVSCLVAVDDVTLSQLIQHRTYLWKKLLSSSFVSSSTQSANSVASSLSIVMVVGFTSSRLANTLQR